MRCFLVDNGSLRVASWLNLVRVAEAVSTEVGSPVEAASVLHSTRIPATDLPPGAVPPTTWEWALKQAWAEGEREFWVLPFFFGASGAITEYLPERVAVLRERMGDFSIHFAPFLADVLPEEAEVSSLTLVTMLADRVRKTAAASGLERAPVILVDHGSPKAAVAAVRDRLARELEAQLGDSVDGVRAASMERREGPEYDFNEPLLERALRDPELPASDVILAHLFLSPGRHAGEGGDIAEICAAAEAERPGLRVHRTALLGDHPAMPALVAARWRYLAATAV